MINNNRDHICLVECHTEKNFMLLILSCSKAMFLNIIGFTIISKKQKRFKRYCKNSLNGNEAFTFFKAEKLRNE